MGSASRIGHIYIAGPYSLGDQAMNVRRAIEAAETLAAQGWIPYVPHLSHFWHLIYPHENVGFWYRQGLAWLERCDCIFRLPGESKGADREVARAIELGLPIAFSLGACGRMAAERIRADGPMFAEVRRA